jgi:hypothetical protein
MIKFGGDQFRNYAEEWGFETPRELADDLASNLKMKDGKLWWTGSEFTAEGTLENGSALSISQHGEYNMYGGPYDPEMHQPDVTLNGREFPLSLIIEALDKAGIEISSGNFPDLPTLSREWGHLLLLKDTTIKAKILGII